MRLRSACGRSLCVRTGLVFGDASELTHIMHVVWPSRSGRRQRPGIGGRWADRTIGGKQRQRSGGRRTEGGCRNSGRSSLALRRDGSVDTESPIATPNTRRGVAACTHSGIALFAASSDLSPYSVCARGAAVSAQCSKCCSRRRQHGRLRTYPDDARSTVTSDRGLESGEQRCDSEVRSA